MNFSNGNYVDYRVNLMELNFLEEQASKVGVCDDGSFLGTHPSIVSTTLRLPPAHFGSERGGATVHASAL